MEQSAEAYGKQMEEKQCPQCEASFYTDEAMQGHAETVHGGIGKHFCKLPLVSWFFAHGLEHFTARPSLPFLSILLGRTSLN